MAESLAVKMSMLGHWDELAKRIVACPDSRLPTNPAIGAGIAGDLIGGLPQVDGMFEPGGSLFRGQNSVKGWMSCLEQQSHEAGHDSAGGSSHGVVGSVVVIVGVSGKRWMK